jgi:hypothetical protein
MESRDPLVFTQGKSEFSWLKIAIHSLTQKRHHTLEFFVIKHRNFRFATPAPENLHGSPSMIPITELDHEAPRLFLPLLLSLMFKTSHCRVS